MLAALPHCLLVLVVSHLQSVFARTALSSRSSLNTDPDGSTFLWLPQDEYSGPSFFEYVGRFGLGTDILTGFAQPLGFFHW